MQLLDPRRPRWQIDLHGDECLIRLKQWFEPVLVERAALMSANDTARTPEPFVYRLKAVAKVMGGDTVVDGDTVDLDLDLGFSITLRQRVRLYGIDAPEVHTKDPIEKAKGLESAYLFVVGHSFLAERILTLQESKQASCRF
jgi:hypothetical protein